MRRAPALPRSLPALATDGGFCEQNPFLWTLCAKRGVPPPGPRPLVLAP